MAGDNLLRERGAPESGRVTQIELFFDLVFVFAVTQLSHTQLANLTALGALQTAVLLTAVWWVWIYTSWVTNWLDPGRRPVQVLLLVMMFAGLILSTSLPHAFGERGQSFAAAYVFMQLGRSLFMLWALAGRNAENFRNFQRIAIWLLGSGILWLCGGAVEGNSRLALWLIALAIEFISPAMGFWTPGLGRSTTRTWDVDASHLAERCAAFILIALGESITMVGAGFYELSWTPPIIAGFVCDFLMIAAMWWIYFDTAAERTSRAFAASRDPGRVARAAYTYVHGFLVAGVIVVAVATGLVLDNPVAKAQPSAAIVLFGGPAIYLISNAVFRRLLHPRIPPSHLAGLAFLAIAALFWNQVSLLGSAAAVATSLLATAVIGHWLQRKEQRLDPLV